MQTNHKNRKVHRNEAKTHFIVNVLNNYKVKRENLKFKLDATDHNKEYILYKGKLIIDERKNLSFEKNSENTKNIKIGSITEKIESLQPICFNDKICNVCDERKINIVSKT